MRVFQQPVKGFTLLELMIALAIFAVINAMAYGGMNQVLKQQAGTAQQADKLKRMQLLYHIMERDFSQLVNRPIRGQYGSVVPALKGDSDYNGVEFTHLGHVNPGGFLRSELQRVRYKLDEGELQRESWRVLDQMPDSEADKASLLKDVEAFEVRYLTPADQWVSSWPPSSTLGASSTADLPKAVDVRLTTAELGELNWYFRMPDS
ncbi:MAG: type II secretion system minor pseudopilin GspJ [Gammaproteobacteria bacterium]